MIALNLFLTTSIDRCLLENNTNSCWKIYVTQPFWFLFLFAYKTWYLLHHYTFLELLLNIASVKSQSKSWPWSLRSDRITINSPINPENMQIRSSPIKPILMILILEVKPIMILRLTCASIPYSLPLATDLRSLSLTLEDDGCDREEEMRKEPWLLSVDQISWSDYNA